MPSLEPTARACTDCGTRPERYDGTYYDPPLCFPCWEARQAAVDFLHGMAIADHYEQASALARAVKDREETADRARAVVELLERAHEELTRLELIESADADDVNALSSAKGFVSRARNALRGRFA